MRKILWKLTILIAFILICESPAFSQGLKGWGDLTKGTTKSLENGDMTTETDTFNRILYLSYSEPVTPALTYQLNLRANMLDTNTTDASDTTESSYQRSVEPALDLLLRNPMYDFSVGYRRREAWTTAHYTDKGRETTDFYYSRFGVFPQNLPSLGIQLDREHHYDYISDSTLDDTNTIFTVNSNYELPSQDLNLRYAINFSQTTNETPLKLTTNSEQENFNGSFNLGYSGFFWNDKAGYSAGYQGNSTRNQTEQFTTRPGAILNERIPLGGLYAQGNSIKNDVDTLTARGSLVNDDLNTSSAIDLNSGQFHNLGILVSSSNAVDRLYIYVNKNVSAETNLRFTSGWKVLKSNFNQAGAWSSVAINSVTANAVDTANNIYRYEIKFDSPQNASFFKAINTALSSVVGTEVTEIEAYGNDDAESSLLTVTTSFNQQINLAVNVRPVQKLSFLMSYSIDRSDDNPESTLSSISGIASNIFSDTISAENSGFSSSVSRNYNVSSIWLTHSMLTTTLRVQRSESFDDTQVTDISSNTYNLALNSQPIPTVDATLTVIRHDSFSFNEKTTSNDSAVLSVGTQLYQDVNMITDVGFTKSLSHTNDTTSSSRRLNGTIDALLTRKLSGSFNYDYSWNTSSDDSTRTSDHLATITYRPGRFVNITSRLSAADANGDMTTRESIQIDWLPLPAIRMNVNYQHSNSEPGPVKTDNLNGFITWYITKFADLRTTYGYTKTSDDSKRETINFKTSLSCRF